MKIKDKSVLIICILIPLAVGSLSSLLSGNMMNSTFAKTSLSPPAFIFPIVWTVLYTLMGISSYMIYTSGHPLTVGALKIYAIQLIFNFFWSIIFFRFSMYLYAFIWLLALIFFIIKMIARFYVIKPLAAYLQIPYLLWCIFAAVLNFMIYRMN